MSETTIIMTDIGSIGSIERICKNKSELECVKLEGQLLKLDQNGLYINQNYIEQHARGIVKGEDKKVIGTNITEENIKIIYNLLFERDFEGTPKTDEYKNSTKPTMETLKELYQKMLIENNGSLSSTMLSIYKDILNINDKAKVSSLKKLIEEKIWPCWANEVFINFIKTNKELLNKKYLVIAAKVSANLEEMKKLSECLNKNGISKKTYYLQGLSTKELLGQKDENGVPYVLSSGKYTNHSNKAIELAKEIFKDTSLTEKQVHELFTTRKDEEKAKDFVKAFENYLTEVIDKRREDVERTSKELAIPTINSKKFEEKEDMSTKYAPKTLEIVGKLNNSQVTREK